MKNSIPFDVFGNKKAYNDFLIHFVHETDWRDRNDVTACGTWTDCRPMVFVRNDTVVTCLRCVVSR